MSDTVDHDGGGPRADHPQAVSICPIDKKSVHRICSGQVVLTLATAVKELLENSIDAGATIVEIKLKDYGSESIEVSDNGSGVESSNFEGLTLKHHTSKLQDFGDLVNVDTFGFRGEALSSLCALCEMSVTTRHRAATVGTKLVFDSNGRITKQISQARQVGTTVSLQNLFYTLPVRHKEFKRNLKKEFVKLVQVLNSYCIVSTGVRISCTNQTGKGSRSVVVSTNGNANLQENISSVFGPKQLQSVLEFVQKLPGEEQCSEFGVNNNQSSIFSIDGFVSKCEHGRGRSSSDRQFFFINGRPFDSTKLTKVVNEVYHQYNRHQYPFVALRIKVEKESVDVNVTPDKRQVFLEREKHLLAIVKASLIALYEPTTSMIQMQMPLTKFSSSRSEQDTEEDHNFTRLTRHHSLEKPDGVSSLMKLKRSFSSAFAKGDLSPPSASGSPRTPVSCSPKKQRKMDSFVSSFIGAPEKLDDSLTNLSPKMRNTSKDCVIVPHKDSVDDNSSGFLVIRGIQSKHISQSEMDTSYENDRLAESQKTIDIDDTGDASSQSRDSNVSIADDVNSITKQSEIAKNDKIISSHGLKLELHHFSHKSEDRLASNEEPVQDIDQSEETGALSTGYQTQVISSCRTQSDTDNKNHQDDSSMDQSQGECDDHDVDQVEELEKHEEIVSFSPKQLLERLGTRRDEQSSKFSRAFRATITPGDNQTAEQELQKEITKDMFAKMEILGQFNKGFIITRLDNDLFIVDQHATDEKYNFETLQRDTVIQSQRLICPQNLELTASNEIILMDNLDTFRKNGFEFVIDENAQPSQRVKLTSTPVSKNWHFGKEDIEEMIFMLSDCPGTMCRPSRVRAMFASRSCRKSIMIGTTLNKSEMKKLVCHMGEIEQPWNCPHGRPTMRHLINLDMVPK